MTTTNDTAFGVTLALKHVLMLLEHAGVVAQGEVTTALDSALSELDELRASGAVDPDAGLAAGQAIGSLYVR
jgi:hypothetical protein